MNTVHYRRWQPARSPVRIEFMPAMLHQIRAETKQDHDRGFLLGSRHSGEIRAFAARRTSHVDDPHLRGTAPVAVYISRARGEVFLTDGDIAFMDQHRADVALVVAGGRAGFFVREADGSMQTVRSYEEFSIADAAAATTVPAVRYSPPIPPRHWRWASAAMGLLAVPAVALAYWLPSPPIELQAREQSGQLLISWDARALDSRARLEIIDASGRTVVGLSKGTASATFAAEGASVEVRVSTDTRTGYLHWARR